ncbi:MAG TPA: hypothetical protein VGQ20_00885 [Acidimicrobiales bacterium]|jgi:hypothetical protein|nr:hypothetical protein [Acidimicrobiales bacterium]
MKPRRIVLSIALLCALVLSACGGGDDSDTATDAGSTATTTASGAGSTGSGSGATTTSPDFKGSGSGNLCDYAKDIESNKSFEEAFSGSADAKSLKDGFNKLLELINTAVSKAPSEIKADLQTLQKGFKAIADFYASYDYDVAKLTAAAQKDPTIMSKLTTLNSADFTAATDRVTAYFEKVCGIKSS